MNEFSHWADPAPLDIDDLLYRLGRQHTRLSRYIDRRWSELDAVALARFLALYGENVSRLGRLLCDWQALHGPPPDPLEQAIDEVLDELADEWGVDLGESSSEGQELVEPPIDIDRLIRDLDRTCIRLDQRLASLAEGEDDGTMSRLFAVYSQNMARLGRLCRVRRMLYPELPAELVKAIEEARLEEMDVPPDAS